MANDMDDIPDTGGWTAERAPMRSASLTALAALLLLSGCVPGSTALIKRIDGKLTYSEEAIPEEVNWQ